MVPVFLPNKVGIIDIRQDNIGQSMVKEIYKHLDPGNGKRRTFPTVLLYDAEGLRLFEEITYLADYYLTSEEIQVLQTHAKAIAEQMPDNTQLVELGSGNLRKIEILLREFESLGKDVHYYALDLSLEELQRTFSEISPESYVHVRFYGLYGMYDDALVWLQNPDNRNRPTCVLSMGSSLGNFSYEEAADFLGRFAALLGPSDTMLVGLDACKNKDRVYRAYNDSKGITHRFYMNGLLHANAILGYDAFKPAEWEIITTYDEARGCHQAFYSPTKDIAVNGIALCKGETVLFEEAFKYDSRERDELWRNAGLIPVHAWGNRADDYHIHLLSSAMFRLPMKPSEYAPNPVPSLEEWRGLWVVWDIITKTMTPQEELLSKPIKLRNALIFYLGHIPTFLDIHLTRATHGELTAPKSYPQIFERGIDPDVDNPEKCHAHSEIPDEWPPLEEILDYQERVRNRLRSIMNMDGLAQDRCLSEALWFGFEHEAMHLETFLYMLLQSEKVIPPQGVTLPDFRGIALQARETAQANKWFTIPQQTLAIGLHDSGEGIPDHSFGWDIEKPQRVISVRTFDAQARPITNGEYARYMELNHISHIPASWVSVELNGHSQNGGSMNGNTNDHINGASGNDICASNLFISKFSVRTIFGPVPLEWALDWPVMSSYDELAGYARWMNCRLPTFEEVKSIYKYSEHLKTADNSCRSPSTQGEVSSLTNGMSCETEKLELDYSRASPRCPDHQPVHIPSIDSMPVFVDLDGCNVGFKHWHPCPVTPYGDRLAGQGGLGGVWEWTSTPMMQHDGYKVMEIYPGYSADFFDGKHNIVLGGSWATHPRLAGRTTFVNWYQHNYPYAWVGARLVRDV